jgi:hypothetical protein
MAARNPATPPPTMMKSHEPVACIRMLSYQTDL